MRSRLAAPAASVVLAFVLAAGTAVLAVEPPVLDSSAAAARARTAAARALDVDAAAVRPLSPAGAVATLDGRRFQVATYADRKGERQAFVAVDLASGQTLDEHAYQALADAVEARLPRLTDEARASIARATRLRSDALLAYVLRPVDYGPAIAQVRAAHPEVGWDGDRPVGDDLAHLRNVSLELMRAKAALLAEARRPFLRDAGLAGARVVTTLDLAPLVYLESSPDSADRLAEHPSVRQVRAPAGVAATMNIAHDAVRANYTDSLGWNGSGVRIGIVEYGRVDYSRPGLGSGARAMSLRVTSTGNSCVTSRGAYFNASATSHVSWAAGIAVGRGRTYKGIANAARLVDASADYAPTSPFADPRVLKAVDCAILQGGADLITMSLVQNDRSRFPTWNAYFDAVVHDHHRLIVGNGGNNYSETNSHCAGASAVVRSPGAAWNVLAVGGTTNDASRLWYRSATGEPAYCYGDPPGQSGDVNDRVKPDIVAPAQNVSSGFVNGSGVSAATPIVAGVAASILEQQPSLLNFPERMRAILLASSHARHARTPGGATSLSAEGLGTVSAKWASVVAKRDRAAWTGEYGGLAFDGATDGGGCHRAPGPQSVTFEVPKSTRKVRFVINWLAHTADAHPASGSTLDRRLSDLNLTIRKGSTIVAASTRSASNVEWVDFLAATHGTGTYTATVSPARWSCELDVEPVGWAYVSFTTP